MGLRTNKLPEQEYLPEQEFTLEEIPGITAPKLKSGFHTTGGETNSGSGGGTSITSGSNIVIKTHTIPKEQSQGEYNIIFPDLGFKPSFVRVQAIMEGSNAYGSSDCSSDGIKTKGLRFSNGSGNSNTLIKPTAGLIYCRFFISSGDKAFTGIFSSFIDNGIKISILSTDNYEDIDLILTFYK